MCVGGGGGGVREVTFRLVHAASNTEVTKMTRNRHNA